MLSPQQSDSETTGTEKSKELETEERPIYCVPTESPLIQAHGFSKKAEQLARYQKYEEAISYHTRAAEMLLIVMKTSPSQPFLESLALQHKSYLRQVDRLIDKTQLLSLLDHRDKLTEFVTQSTQTDNLQSVCSDQPMKEEDVYEILRENVDLMKDFIKAPEKEQVNDIEASGVSDKSYKSINLCESGSSDGLGGGSDKSQNSWKLVTNPQSRYSFSGNSEKLDEVLEMNEKLTQCVTGLLHELSVSHAEKRRLEERLADAGDAMTPLAEPALQFSTLNFPPLESLYPEIGHFSPPKD